MPILYKMDQNKLFNIIYYSFLKTFMEYLCYLVGAF